MTHLSASQAIAGAPPHWHRTRFKSIATRIEEHKGSRDLELLSLASAGYLSARIDGGNRQQPAPESVPRYLAVEPGDLVVNPMWLTGGSIAVTGIPGAVSPDYRVFRMHPGAHPRFVHHLMRSRPYLDQYQLYTRADTTFDRRVQQGDLDNLPMALPPFDEQRRIAAFLDDQAARIDRVIEQRERQIKLESERLASVIANTDDALTMEFGLISVRHIVRSIHQGWSPQCEDRAPELSEWGVLKAGCVNGGTFRASEIKALPAEMVPRIEYLVQRGDLLVNRASGSLDLIGSAAVVGHDLHPKTLLCDKVYRVDLREAMDRTFFSLLWRSPRIRQELRERVSGAEGMANSLPSGVIKAIQVPNASAWSQQAAAERLKNEEHRAEFIQSLMRSQVLLLQERKLSLITAAVTGDFDVNSASAHAVAGVTS